jgi:hypothetical protein
MGQEAIQNSVDVEIDATDTKVTYTWDLKLFYAAFATPFPVISLDKKEEVNARYGI